uniref:Uncharacterized protein n=1 Tax=Quercus lobata TaxID=97700 RepID=A0A7N2L136_QUELO
MLDLVRELNRVALENTCATLSEASTQATGHGRRGGGFGGRGHAGGCGGGREDEDELDDEALEGNWDMYMDGASAEHTSHAQVGPRSPLPTRPSPSLLSGSAHEGGCIFAPTPSLPTPPVVQAEPTQEPSLPNPDESAAQIEQMRNENIEVAKITLH